ncbi:MAG: Gfo/Idh/MocA family oxidoreductase [Planctomycetaceae bacterium]
MSDTAQQTANRRDFLKTSGTVASIATLAAAFPASARAYADGDEILKVGLVGCGGRGTDAASNALSADPYARLTAMGDVFEDKLTFSHNTLQRHKQVGEQVKVDDAMKFIGTDAYQKVVDNVDVVLLCTPPGFRPEHFKYAVEAGKHIFIEKPMATDAVGVRSVRESVELSKTKPICVVAGFCWRYDYAKKALFERVLDGQIGDVTTVLGTYLTNPVRPMQPAHKRGENVSNLEWMLRNWYNFTWLSGDGLVEQACHTVDWLAWAKGDKPPASCTAVGGRQIPAEGGNIFDHIEVNYVWDDGTRGFIAQRQISGCHNENSCYVLGTKGQANISKGNFITGENAWRYEGETPSMYEVEHRHLFSAIRNGEIVNDGDRMWNSTLMAIMGRMAGYTGQEITWQQALDSQEKLVPDITNGLNTPVEFPEMAMPVGHRWCSRPAPVLWVTWTSVSGSSDRGRFHCAVNRPQRLHQRANHALQVGDHAGRGGQLTSFAAFSSDLAASAISIAPK